jgi:tRNA-binding protein
MTMAEITDFMKLDMRIGEIISVEYNDKAINPAYKLQINFGDEIGVKNSSAQLCENYKPDELMGRKIISVVNFPAKKIAGFKSEVLVLAAVTRDKGTVLLKPDFDVEIGSKIL